MAMGFGKLAVRAVAGGLMAGHGAQKLFGAFDGPGLDGTSGMMANLNLQPANRWAQLAGVSEFAGGVCTALGFMHPVGPLCMLGAMGTATRTVHWNKPIWSTSGGAELPVVYMAVAASQLLSGPGPISIDTVFRTRMPSWVGPLGLIAVGGGLAYVASRQETSDVSEAVRNETDEAAIEKGEAV